MVQVMRFKDLIVADEFEEIIRRSNLEGLFGEDDVLPITIGEVSIGFAKLCETVMYMSQFLNVIVHVVGEDAEDAEGVPTLTIEQVKLLNQLFEAAEQFNNSIHTEDEEEDEDDDD